jgi:hypothetical protein
VDLVVAVDFPHVSCEPMVVPMLTPLSVWNVQFTRW